MGARRYGMSLRVLNSIAHELEANEWDVLVLKHFISVDGAVSDIAFAIQLIASSKAISLQSSETLSALSILLKSDRSWCFLYRALKARIIPRSRLKTRNLILAASLKLSRSV